MTTPSPASRIPKVLAAVVIGGLLAIIAREMLMVKSHSDYLRHKRSLQAMKSDLRDLERAEAVFFARYGRFTANPGELGDSRVRSSPGVRIVIQRADSAEWRAIATHVQSADTCVVGGRASDRAADSGAPLPGPRC